MQAPLWITHESPILQLRSETLYLKNILSFNQKVLILSLGNYNMIKDRVLTLQVKIITRSL